MALDQLIATGRARLSFAIVIEGWPDVWVTDTTLNSCVSDDRTVRVGLQYEGLQFRERTLPGEGKLESDAITFRCVSQGPDDEATASFANYQQPVAVLESALTTSATTIDLVGSNSLADGYYYIGTETIQVSTFPTIVRQQWDSNAQKHFVADFDGELATFVYDSPPTLEGRRVELYCWERDDTKTLAGGTIIWRGVFATPARLDDGLTWLLTAQHIVSLLRQKVVGTPTEIHPAGIYHHAQCAVVVSAYLNGTQADFTYDTGWYATEKEMADAADALLQTAVYTTLSTTTSQIANIGFERTASGYAILMRTGSSPPSSFNALVGSPLIGYPHQDEWIRASDEVVVTASSLAANTDYVRELLFDTDQYLLAGGQMPRDALPSEYAFPTSFLGPTNIIGHDGSLLTTDVANLTTYPPYRIYVDRDLSSLALVTDHPAVHIEDTNNPNGMYRVTFGTDGNSVPYVDVESPLTIAVTGGIGWNSATKGFGNTQSGHVPALGHLSGETTIQPVVDYGTGSLANFVGTLITNGVDANAGVVPYIVSDDIGNFVFWDVSLNVAGSRSYLFADAVALEDIIAQELLLIGGLLYVDSSGKLAARPSPLLASTAAASATVDTTDIITPAGDAGSWPAVDFQRDGLVNQVTIQEGYDPVEGEWKGRPYVVIDRSSVAEHKNRGRGAIEIKPYSQAGTDAIDESDAGSIGGRYLQLMARPYVAITVQVRYSAFNLLLGDTVLLTCPQIPNGAGGRGFTNRRAFIVERKWNFELDSNQFGELVLWALLDEPYGYAPSAIVTGQSNTVGNTWVLTCSSSNTQNIGWSTLGDGKVLQHFAAGDLIEVMIYDNTGLATPIAGTVNSVTESSDQINVTFGGTWTPGSSTWVLEFQADAGGATDNMRKYVYIADANLLLADASTIARRQA